MSAAAPTVEGGNGGVWRGYGGGVYSGRGVVYGSVCMCAWVYTCLVGSGQVHLLPLGEETRRRRNLGQRKVHVRLRRRWRELG